MHICKNAMIFPRRSVTKTRHLPEHNVTSNRSHMWTIIKFQGLGDLKFEGVIFGQFSLVHPREGITDKLSSIFHISKKIPLLAPWNIIFHRTWVKNTNFEDRRNDSAKPQRHHLAPVHTPPPPRRVKSPISGTREQELLQKDTQINKETTLDSKKINSSTWHNINRLLFMYRTYFNTLTIRACTNIKS
jgi:hypothetical protein